MRKLILKLNLNVPANSNKARNLALITHRGAQVLVRSGIPTVLDITEDPLTDTEIQAWYRTRYTGFGLGLSIENDAKVALSAPKAEVVPEIKVEAEEVKAESVDVVDPVETVTVEKTEPVKMEAPESFKEEVEKKASVKPKKPSVNDMTYFEMVRFAKEHNIEVGGRAKELHVKAIKKWLKEHKDD